MESPFYMELQERNSDETLSFYKHYLDYTHQAFLETIPALFSARRNTGSCNLLSTSTTAWSSICFKTLGF